jgi:hypothetical protein
MNGEQGAMHVEPGEDPRPAAVAFATTEHFTLQSARSATISESTSRANMFLGVVSGGLVALGLVAAASHVGAVFDAFALILLPTAVFVGVVTFERVVQSGVEDFGYARRIAQLRAFYFEAAPELTPYLLSVPSSERLHVMGLWGGRWQGFRTVAGMVAVVTAVLAGSAAGVLAAIVTDRSLVIALAAGAAVAIAALVPMMLYQQAAWRRAASSPIFVGVDTQQVPPPGR